MKRLTIVFSILLLLGFAGMMGYIAMSPDFTEPASLAGEGEDPNAPVWGMSMEDLISYLEEKGFLTRDEVYEMSGGIGTLGYGFRSAEIYWWDLDDLAEGSDEAAAYQDALEEGSIDLWQMGQYYLAVTKNGPFALSTTVYEGDPIPLTEAFLAFGQAGGVNSDAPVWDMTMEDLESYLVDKGLVDLSTKMEWVFANGTEVVCKINGADFYWWDLENLDPEGDAYEEYAGYRDDGFYVFVNGTGETVFMQLNGPFGLRSSGLDTRDADGYDGDIAALVEAFEAFGRE